MALTILYRRRDRAEEPGMTMISARENIAAMVDQREKRGFVIDKITVRSAFAGASAIAERA